MKQEMKKEFIRPKAGMHLKPHMKMRKMQKQMQQPKNFRACLLLYRVQEQI